MEDRFSREQLLGDLRVVRCWFSGCFRCQNPEASLGVRSWFSSGPWFTREALVGYFVLLNMLHTFFDLICIFLNLSTNTIQQPLYLLKWNFGGCLGRLFKNDIFIIEKFEMVIDLKVLVRSFNCESRACYVGNPRESFFSSSRK